MSGRDRHALSLVTKETFNKIRTGVTTGRRAEVAAAAGAGDGRRGHGVLGCQRPENPFPGWGKNEATRLHHACRRRGDFAARGACAAARVAGSWRSERRFS